MHHTIYIRRRGKVVPPSPQGTELLPLAAPATLSKNLEGLGYALSPRLLEALRALTLEQLAELQKELVAALSRMVGADRPFTPMYLGFPSQVMKTSEAELYLNALVHYWSEGKLFPAQRKPFKWRLQDIPPLKYVDLGTQEEFEGLFGQVVSSNVSLSEQDKLDIVWFLKNYGDGIERLLPESVPQKENAAFLGARLLRETSVGEALLRRTVRTATDVLRLAVALSGGDVSLAEATKFGKLARSQRRLILDLLEERPSLLEDMLRWKERWKRLGERLHPREFEARYPKTAKAFEVLRNDVPSATFNGVVEATLRVGDVRKASSRLASRPGDLVRRLDHLLRLDVGESAALVDKLRSVAPGASTPVLLQARHHFVTRNETRELRVFFPKGNVAKAHAEPNRLPPLTDNVALDVAIALEEALLERFSALPSLGKTFVDPVLRDYPVPFAVRSASKSLRTLPRGSRLALPEADTLRMFLWWKNGTDRTDIDLSAAMFGDNFVYRDVLSYYNLKGYGGCHSGDIVDAPTGASEFIDVSVSKLRERGVRYVAMVLTSYTQQPYVELPECFAGWMARANPNSGEVYEPRTVQDRLDLAADTQVAVPIVFDVVEGKAIWCDMALRRHPSFSNQVDANKKGITLTIRSLVELNKPTLYDLFSLHARARGELVDSVDGADTVFSVEAGTPFELERIASEFMA